MVHIRHDATDTGHIIKRTYHRMYKCQQQLKVEFTRQPWPLSNLTGNELYRMRYDVMVFDVYRSSSRTCHYLQEIVVHILNQKTIAILSVFPMHYRSMMLVWIQYAHSYLFFRARFWTIKLTIQTQTHEY